MNTALYWFLTIVISLCMDGIHGKAETELIHDLLKSYNKDVLPRLNPRSPVMVNLTIAFKRIIKLKEAEQTLKTDIWLTQSWKNELMAWSPENYNGIKSIHIQKGQLWLPDTLVLNDVANDSSRHFFDNSTYILLHHNGRHETYFPLILMTSCLLDVSKFPFDEQTCKIEFSTWTNDVTRVVLKHPTNFSSNSYQESSAWKLLSGQIYTKDTKYECCPHPFSRTTLEIKLRRNSLFYTIILLFPITVAWIPILMGFIAPTESGERISFSIGVLLTLVFYIEVINKSLPRNSNHIPIFGKYYAGVVIIIVLSTFFTAVVTKSFYRKDYKLSTDFNAFQKSLLHVGSRIPYIGPKCKALIKLKMKHVNQLQKSRINDTLSELTNEETSFQTADGNEQNGEGRLSSFVNRIQSLDEGFEEELNDKTPKQRIPSLRRRNDHMTIQDCDTSHKENAGDDKPKTSKQHVTRYHKKLKTLKSISLYLAKIIRSMRKQKEIDLKHDKQVQYANAVVQLVDRIILTLFTTILVVWFMVSIGKSILGVSN